MVDHLLGFAAADAVLLFTATVDKPLPRRDIDGALKAAQDASAVALLLNATGWAARPIRVQETFLKHLEGPTLVEAASGGWLMVKPLGEDAYQATGAEGAVSLNAEQLRPLLGMWALEWRIAPPTTATLWGRALHALKRHRRVLTQILMTTLVLQGLTLLLPQATRIAMDQALPSGAPSQLSLVAIGLALMALTQAWVGWLRQRAVLFLETRIEAELGRDFTGHVLQLPFTILQKHKLGDLLQAHAGLEAARGIMTERLLGNVLDGVMAIFTFCVMVATMPGPSMAIGALSIVLVALVIGIGRLQEGLMTKGVAAQAAEQGYLVELLKGVATVKAAGSERNGLRHWTKLLSAHLNLALRRQRIGLWNEIGLEGLRQAAGVMILIWGGRLVLLGETQVGSLLAFVQLSSTYLNAMLGMATAYLSWRMVRPQLKRAQALLDEKPEPLMIPGSGIPADGPVEVEDLWFRYSPDLPWVLKGYNLRVEPGEKRWIHAPSGFGKTTLLRVLAGLCTPERGAVRIGGHSPSSAKGHVVYLPQSTQLYCGTIMENLRLLSGGAPTERLMGAAETSGLDTWIKTLPMGYHTVVAQGGGNLSGGQRQLVALTAAMASECKLLLLDEAMANLDWVTKSWLHHSPWFENKTVIYASHDAGMG